jgi:hypothetical protein
MGGGRRAGRIARGQPEALSTIARRLSAEGFAGPQRRGAAGSKRQRLLSVQSRTWLAMCVCQAMAPLPGLDSCLGTRGETHRRPQQGAGGGPAAPRPLVGPAETRAVVLKLSVRARIAAARDPCGPAGKAPSRGGVRPYIYIHYIYIYIYIYIYSHAMRATWMCCGQPYFDQGPCALGLGAPARGTCAEPTPALVLRVLYRFGREPGGSSTCLACCSQTDPRGTPYWMLISHCKVIIMKIMILSV